MGTDETCGETTRSSVSAVARFDMAAIPAYVEPRGKNGGMEQALTPTAEMVRQFYDLFVNRRAYTVQSMRPHSESGRHYYYRPTDRETGKELGLTAETIRQHLAGEITIGLYAINPKTQRSKWVAIDADYRTALEDLLKLEVELSRDEVEAALEKSRRGAHLWVFFGEPVVAREARAYVLNLAARLKLAVKGSGLPEGIEVFPRQDAVREGEFGNAMRAPLGVHRGAGKRYWFYHADYTLEAQFRYLQGIRRVNEGELKRFIAGKTAPPQASAPSPPGRWPRTHSNSDQPEFRILDYVQPKRRVGRNYIAQCPACAQHGHDTSGDNLGISVEEPLKYKCWAGCTKEMIRAALGRPIPIRRSA